MEWLFEIHDKPWFPNFLRREVLDALQMILERTDAYGPIAPRLRRAIDRAGTREVVDLFSGGGGPWQSFLERYEAQGAPPVEVFLTDKFPSATRQAYGAAQSHLHFVTQSTDATITAALPLGFRTIFSSFHHFNREQARCFLADGAAKGQGIGIFEVASRHAFTLLSICALPLLAWVFTPLQRPLRLSPLIWTYFIPVVPLVLFADGIISCFRAYSLSDLNAFTTGLPIGQQNYEWQIGEERGRRLPLRITYLIGCPKNS